MPAELHVTICDAVAKWQRSTTFVERKRNVEVTCGMMQKSEGKLCFQQTT